MFNNEIKLFLLETVFLFSKLREYLEIVDKSLNFEENRVWQYSDETLRKSFYWESKKFAFEYFWPLAKHYSFITLLHLMMEERLRQLCEIVRANDEQLNENTLGNGIEDYMGFLEKGKRYEMKRVEISEWQNITDFEKIRNCIVHAYGRIEYVKSKDQKRLQELVKVNRSLQIATNLPQSSQIIPSFDYCCHAVSSAKVFFREVCDHLIPK